MVQLSLVDTSTSVSKNFGEKVGDVCNKKEKEPKKYVQGMILMESKSMKSRLERISRNKDK